MNGNIMSTTPPPIPPLPPQPPAPPGLCARKKLLILGAIAAVLLLLLLIGLGVVATVRKTTASKGANTGSESDVQAMDQGEAVTEVDVTTEGHDESSSDLAKAGGNGKTGNDDHTSEPPTDADAATERAKTEQTKGDPEKNKEETTKTAPPNASDKSTDSPTEDSPEISRKFVLGVTRKSEVRDPQNPSGVPNSPSGSTSSAANASEFANRVEREGGQNGEYQVTLIWNNLNDLDLHMYCPSGEQVYYANKYSKCGAELDIDMNAGGPRSHTPVENIVWPGGPPKQGKFTIWVDHFRTRGGKSPTSFQVLVKWGGKTRAFKGSLQAYESKRITQINLP